MIELDECYLDITHDDFNEPQNEHYKEYSNILHKWANNVYSKITEHIYLTKYSNYYFYCEFFEQIYILCLLLNIIID